MGISLFCLMTALPSAVADLPQQFSARELAEANQNALDQVRAIDLVIQHDTKQYLHGGKQLVGTVHPPKIRWTRKGDVERLRYGKAKPVGKEGRPDGLYDWLFERSRVKMLRNWDPKDPQPITPINQGTVKAQILPRNRYAHPFHVTTFLLWSFALEGDADYQWTLRELVRDSPRVEVAGPLMLEGREVWQLRIQHPETGGTPRPDCRYEVFVEPQSNFAVRKVISYQPMEQQINGKLEKYTMKVTRTVKEFADKGEGVFVPVKVETRYEAGTSDSRVIETTTRVENLIVNEPLPADALDFRFPEHARVVDVSQGTGERQQVLLWGPDDRPVMQITKLADIPGYAEEKEKDEQMTGGDGHSTRNWLLWLNLGGLLLVLLGIVAFRRIRKRG